MVVSGSGTTPFGNSRVQVLAALSEQRGVGGMHMLLMCRCSTSRKSFSAPLSRAARGHVSEQGREQAEDLPSSSREGDVLLCHHWRSSLPGAVMWIQFL